MAIEQSVPVLRTAVRSIDQELAAFDTELQQYRNRPKDGSPYLADEAEWNGSDNVVSAARREIHSEGLHHLALMVENVKDHLVALRAVLDVGDKAARTPLYAHMTIGRVAYEAAAKIAYLLDPKLDSRQRLLRAAIIAREDAINGAKAARTVPDRLLHIAKPGIDAAMKRVQDLSDRLSRAEVSELTGKDQKTVAYLGINGGVQQPVSVKNANLVADAFPEKAGLYQYGSGVTHSWRWMLGDAEVGDGLLGPDLLGIGALVQTCVKAAGIVSTAYATYFGYNSEESDSRRRLRVRALEVWMEEHVQQQGFRWER
ncbi:hypothetical protein [Pilimelia columellifera]|uniref:Uncharacterized protein n=1 Tax=Pilimelia columellifera subsp. columellifera TaxID=706583 RepID=A0ABN3NI23_9ACTN